MVPKDCQGQDFDGYWTIAGELWEWYEKSQREAIALEISPREVDWLLQEMAGLDKLTLRLASKTQSLPLQCSLATLQDLWQQRLDDRPPLQYLLGRSHWRDFSLEVAPGVLIPRPETEEIIDIVLNIVAKKPILGQGVWVDLGTGSGAIALALAKNLPESTIYAVDISPVALTIARRNANTLGLGDRIIFQLGSWWQPLASLQGKIRGMVSNPPYIPTSLIPQLQPEVKDHEPHLALDGGSDGLSVLRYLVDTGSTYLEPGGVWLVEMMAGQGSGVRELLQQQGDYTGIEIMADLAGLDRFTLCFRRKK